MAVQKSTKTPKVLKIAAAAIFTPLVCVATMIFSIYVPHTRGFFNIGETMVYITALIFGPLVGAFAGGVGSALADVLLGYVQYWPGTLVIKACEGAIVGFLASKMPKIKSKTQWISLTVLMGILVGSSLSLVGAQYYSGSIEVYFGLPPPENPTSIINIPAEFWYILGGIVVLLIILMGLLLEPEFGWIIASIFAGGLAMVVGYFLYEQLILGVLAVAEIPINIGQMLVGLIVAVPVFRAVKRYLRV